MAGHSKWANIRRRKERQDSKRGKLFTKLTKDVTIAARQGGGDIGANPALKTAVDKAKANNVPNRNIDRAIARGTGTLDGVTVSEITYEGYGPNGVAILIDCLTDNKNRTVAEIRSTLNRNSGSLADAGSVAYVFAQSKEEPTFKVPLDDEGAGKLEGLIGALESIEDIVEIYHNADI